MKQKRGRHNWHESQNAQVCSRCGLHRQRHPSVKRWFAYSRDGNSYGLYDKFVPPCDQNLETA